MNRENVLKAIAVMKRAKEHESVYMKHWQTASSCFVKNEEELHACGNKACFAGHIAISPEFKEDGGYASDSGMPCYIDKYHTPHLGASAISTWLDIDYLLADEFVYGDPYIEFSNFYDKNWEEVNADDVILKLEEILATEKSVLGREFDETIYRL